jgi:hypothetical protein
LDIQKEKAMNTKLPDPNVVEQLLSAIEKHPFATLSVIVLVALAFGLSLVLRKRS